MTSLYRSESSYPKPNAQHNLEGRTHYVDDATLSFHKSRIISTHIAYGGLLFGLVESYAVDYRNTRRLFRGVVFDIFGTVLTKCELEEGVKTSERARKVMFAEIDKIDGVAHTLEAIERHRASLNREMDELAARVSDNAREAGRMNTYTIRHGNIAACLTVEMPDGSETVFIYTAPDHFPATVTRYERDQFKAFEALPLEVRAAVNRQFGEVFSLPVERRGAWVQAQVPFTVETH